MNRIALSLVAFAFSTLAVAQSPADQQALQVNKVDSLNMINGVVSPAKTGTTPSSVVTRPSVRKPASNAAPKAAAPKAAESVGGAYDHHDEKQWNAGIDIGYVLNRSDWRGDPDYIYSDRDRIDGRNDGTDFGFDLNLQRSFGGDGPYRNMWFVEAAYMYNRHSGVDPRDTINPGNTPRSYFGHAHSIYLKAGANILQLMDFVTDDFHKTWSLDFQTGLGLLFNSGQRVYESAHIKNATWNTTNLVVPLELELVHTINENWALSAEFYTVYIPGDLYDWEPTGDRDAIFYFSLGVRRHFEWF